VFSVRQFLTEFFIKGNVYAKMDFLITFLKFVEYVFTRVETATVHYLQIVLIAIF